MVASRTDKSQSLMKLKEYFRHAAAWYVRTRRDLVWWATAWEVSGGTNFGEGNTIGFGAMVGCAAIRGNGSILGGTDGIYPFSITTKIMVIYPYPFLVVITQLFS